MGRSSATSRIRLQQLVNNAPFYANYGWHPAVNSPRETDALHPASEAYAHWIKGAIGRARGVLRETRTRMARHADQKRKEAPAHTIGDAVMLSTKHLWLKRPSKKLGHKYVGPFQIEKVGSPSAVRPTLPQSWRTHPTPHVSEIEPFVTGSRPSPDFAKVLREVGELEAEEECDVEEIMGNITRRKRVLYLVKWLGFPPERDWTYEPFENFSEAARQKLEEFHKHPGSAMDYRLRPTADAAVRPPRPRMDEVSVRASAAAGAKDSRLQPAGSEAH